MGVLNVTPDSFSDGGEFLDPSSAASRAETLAEQGADIIDVGGESTRPGATPVSAEVEWQRVGPVLERIVSLPVLFSIDTTKSEIAARALDLGVSIINDVSGLRADLELARLAARSGAGLVLMHMRGDPRTMQADLRYDDLIGEVRNALRASMDEAIAAGCEAEQVALDPGLGFGKSAEGSLELIGRLDELGTLGRPLVVGPSRKSFIGQVLGLPPVDRVEGTIAACVLGLERGARVFRVHDVEPVRRALDLADAVRKSRSRRSVTTEGDRHR